MLAAFAEAGRVLGRSDYTAAAARCAAFVLDSLRDDGRLLRTYKDGEAKLKAYLEDYAYLVNGLLLLHEATFEGRWLREAVDLGQDMVELFWDEATGQFYDTGIDHEELVVRPRDTQDNATPSGSAMAADVLLRLAVITGDGDLERRAVTSMRSTMTLMSQYPMGAGHWLSALDFYLATVKEIAIIGDGDGARELALEVYRHYLPNRVLVGGGADDTTAGLPLMEGRGQLGGQATAYVCRNYVCDLPVNQPEALARQLAS